MNVTRLSGNDLRCPNCKKEMDALSSLEESDKPKVNDFVVCFYCGTVSRIGEGFYLKEATVGDLLYLKASNPDGYEILAKAQFLIIEKLMKN